MKIDIRMTHKWLVLASDGLWDFFNPTVFSGIMKDLPSLCKSRETSQDIADELIKAAKLLGSNDNISVLVLKIN